MTYRAHVAGRRAQRARREWRRPAGVILDAPMHQIRVTAIDARAGTITIEEIVHLPLAPFPCDRVIFHPVYERHGVPPGMKPGRAVYLSGETHARDNGPWIVRHGPWRRPRSWDLPVTT